MRRCDEAGSAHVPRAAQAQLRQMRAYVMSECVRARARECGACIMRACALVCKLFSNSDLPVDASKHTGKLVVSGGKWITTSSSPQCSDSDLKLIYAITEEADIRMGEHMTRPCARDQVGTYRFESITSITKRHLWLVYRVACTCAVANVG